MARVKAEAGVMLPKPRPPGDDRSWAQEKEPSLGPLEGHQPAHTLLQTSGPRTERIHFCRFNHHPTSPSPGLWSSVTAAPGH